MGASSRASMQVVFIHVVSLSELSHVLLGSLKMPSHCKATEQKTCCYEGK
jgi:hypothetical protein